MMASDPRFDDMATFDPNEPTRKRSKWTTCLIGCLAILGVMLVCAVLVGVWVARNWRGWVADFGSQAVNQGIDELELPVEEKQEIKVQVNRVAEALRDGKLSGEQAGRIVEKLVQSPLMPSLVVLAADKQYLENSGLSDDEKAEGRKTLQRFARGMIDGKIDEKAMDTVLSHVADRQPDGNWELRQKVSDEDLRAALAEAKLHADQAEIPEEPETFDPSDEFKKIIDESLSEPGVDAQEAAPNEPGADGETAPHQ